MKPQITPIPGVGLAVIMQDITHLKELDRIKTDFDTVSHDLRSPLTAILGYVGARSKRVGPVSNQQHRIYSPGSTERAQHHGFDQ